MTLTRQYYLFRRILGFKIQIFYSSIFLLQQHNKNPSAKASETFYTEKKKENRLLKMQSTMDFFSLTALFISFAFCDTVKWMRIVMVVAIIILFEERFC